MIVNSCKAFSSPMELLATSIMLNRARIFVGLWKKIDGI